MNHKMNLLFVIGLACAGLTSLNAQTAIVPAGGNGTGSGGSISYSVGQVVYTTATGSNGSVAQGVQQPYEISVVTGLENKKIDLSMSVYPNPAQDYLKLRIDNEELIKYQFHLLNINGNLLKKDNVEAHETEINLQRLPSGTYFLKITQG